VADRNPILPGDPLFIQDDLGYSPEVLSDMQAADVTFDPSLYPPLPPEEPEITEEEFLQNRLDAATPYDRYLYESFGLEPGLDRATFLPFASGSDGEQQLAFPALAYDILKGLGMPGAAVQGVPITPEEVALGAMEFTGGGLTTGSVPVTASETLMGMAARPKSAFMRPTASYDYPDPLGSQRLMPGNPDIQNPITGKYGTDPTNIRQYEKSLKINLIDQGVDEKVATTVGEKATKYFMKEFGTADDRLRQGLLKGDIEPEFYDLGETPFPPALARQTEIYSNLEKARQGDPAAQEIFEKDYDSATGLKRTIIRPPSADVDPFDPLPEHISEAQKMLDEGVPPSLISNAYGGQFTGLSEGYNPLYLEADVKTPDEFLKNFGPQFRRYSPESTADLRDLTFEPTSYLRDTAPELIRAMDQGDMIYELDENMLESTSQGLDFLAPYKVAQDLSNLPNKQLEKASFPDLIMQGKKALPTPDKEQKKAASKLSEEDARRENTNQDAQTADERNAAVPTELKTKVGVTSYLTPNNDRTWYSLDTDAALQLEGGLMRHSIGGYAKNGNYPLTKRDDFAAGDIKVFSLREKDGQPRVTTDIGYRDASMVFRESGVGKPFVIDAYGYNNMDVRNEDLKDLFALWKELGIPSGPRADPKGVLTDGVTGKKLGKGEQYAAYLQTGDIFSLQDARNFLARENPVMLDVPDLPEDFSGGGIVSLANGGAVERGIVTL
jgi:hypothetical protein